MTNDEKAKAYDEALEDMRVIYPNLKGDAKLAVEHAFPQLRESEDEKIRKWLVDYFGSIKETVWIHRDITCEQILDWLEKQKPAEWGEEDKKILDDVSHILIGLNYKQIAKDYKQAVEKLIYARPSWKPSEEQIRSLEYFISLWGDSDGQLKYAKIFNDIKSLCEQLKKL